MAGFASRTGGAARCTAPCPSTPRDAVSWRREWDARLDKFVAEHAEGIRWRESMRVPMAAGPWPIPKDQFIWNVY